MLVFAFDSLNLIYSNINSYKNKKLIINNFIERNDINCALFVESKTDGESNTSYRDWHTIQQDGYKRKKVRGGSLVQVHPSLKMGKANKPKINNPLDEATHFTIPFLTDKLHILLVYSHPHSTKIDDTIFNKAALYKYVVILGDFNATHNKRKKSQITNFLNNSSFKQYR